MMLTLLTYPLLVKNMAAVAAARMPGTEIEAYKDDGESDFPRFLDSVLQRIDQISQTKVDEEIVEQHIVVVDQTVRLLRILRYTPVYPESAVRILTPMTKKP